MRGLERQNYTFEIKCVSLSCSCYLCHHRHPPQQGPRRWLWPRLRQGWIGGWEKPWKWRLWPRYNSKYVRNWDDKENTSLHFLEGFVTRGCASPIWRFPFWSWCKLRGPWKFFYSNFPCFLCCLFLCLLYMDIDNSTKNTFSFHPRRDRRQSRSKQRCKGRWLRFQQRSKRLSKWACSE